jgi:hypothetical protein
MPRVIVTACIEPELCEAIDAIAKREDRTRSRTVERLLRTAVNLLAHAEKAHDKD